MLVFERVLFVLIWLTTFSFCYDSKVCFDDVSNSSTAVTALILARGGSKGIKLKNIQTIDSVSLLGISLTALQETKLFETIWVSTDHEDIAAEAERCSSIKISFRQSFEEKYFQTRFTFTQGIQKLL